MDNDKRIEFDEDIDLEKEQQGSGAPHAPRARNRTVMLSPDVTGEVRARIAKDLSERRSGSGGKEPPSPAMPPRQTSVPERDIERPAAPRLLSVSEQEPEMPLRAVTGVERGVERSRPQAYEPSAPVDAATPPQASNRPSDHAPNRPAAAAQSACGDRLIWNKETPIVGFLVSFDKNQNGDVFPLRVGRMIVTSENSAGGNCLLLEDESISPMHAILRVNRGGDVQLLDQLSEHGTKIRHCGSDKEEELSGDKSTLGHGDIVRFGARTFYVCFIVLDNK